MVVTPNVRAKSAVFITFSGNCKKALTFYQSCFGGTLHLQPFKTTLQAYKEIPIVSGSLLADTISIYGSDLVHEEGRRLGNYMAIFFACENKAERNGLIEKLAKNRNGFSEKNDEDQNLIELTDTFGVRWVLGIQ